MVQNVVEARERPEDEQDVAGTEADELGAGSDTRVVAPRRRPETGRDPRDVRAVADRGLTVREVLDEQVRCLRGLVDRALEREEICEVEKNFDVLDGLVGVVQIRVVEAVDRKSTRLNSSHVAISYAVFCLKK